MTGSEKESEALARAAEFVAALPLPAFFLCPGRRIASWNERAADYLGYRREEVIGRNLDETLEPQLLAASQDHSRTTAAAHDKGSRGGNGTNGRNASESLLFSFRAGDGSRRLAETWFSPFAIQNATCHLWLLKPVPRPHATQSNSAEARDELNELLLAAVLRLESLSAATRASDERQRAMFQLAADAMVRADARGMIVAANQACRRLLGYEPGELIGRNVRVLAPEPHRSAHDGYLERFHRTGEKRLIGTTREVMAVRADGSEVPILLSLSDYDDGHGNRMFLGLMRDISAEKAALAHGEKQRELLEAQFDTFPLPTYYWERTPEGDFRLAKVNASALRVTDGAVTGLFGKTMTELYADTPEVIGDFTHTWETGEVLRRDCDYRMRSTGRLVFMRTTYVPIPDRGIMVHTEDLSAERSRRLMEDELRAARDQAESANHAKTLFLATVSHEIRTPLNAVLGFADLLGMSALTAQQKQYVDGLLSAGKLLHALLTDVLDIARIESGGLELEEIAFETEDLLAHLRATFSHAAEDKGLYLIIERARDVPARLQADRTRLMQVMVNLIGNAIKYSDSGLVRATLSFRAEHGEHPLLVFEVTDEGPGVPAEEQESIFHLFQTGLRKTRGAGIGLFLARRIARSMGGDVTLESPRQVNPAGVPFGSRFTATFLVRTLEQQAPAPEPGSLPLPAYRRILLIEDNQVNIMVLGGLLTQLGMRPDIATTGHEGIRRAEREPYDLILLDLGLPDISGFAVARHLRHNNISAPIVALTASALDEDRRRAAESGIDDYVPKPVGRDRLIELLRAWPAGADATTKGAASD